MREREARFRQARGLFVVQWVVLGVCAEAGCSPASTATDTPAGTGGGCPAYVSAADLSKPATSLARDVLPIFSAHCAVGGASCHGDPSVVAQARPLLGVGASDASPAEVASAIFGGLVGVKSSEDLSMDLVAAGDPEQSFLMHKMDGDQCRFISECMVDGSYRPNCGVFMPYQAPTVIDPSLRDVVRRWIAQGARND
ncbi:MAG TPA: hypothetical protein VKU41_14645 [Polyangiaceae bacterium]|nr:hypothetical protein [Polyangiaceae bacterium]